MAVDEQGAARTTGTASGGLTLRDRRFLDRPRLGFLTVAAPGRWPTPVPVWFETDEQSVQLFTFASSAKARRLRANPRASLVAANHVGEPEHWVAVTGPARIEPNGAHDLAARLAARYWDLSDPARAAALESWRSAPLVGIVIETERVTRYSE
jgi:nitroimidazol reductase NimA-like FMN-containing flavoprotein (pyridoxamine 5'-phosphate oxidase superfamily)